MIRLFRQDGLEIMLNIDMIKEIADGSPTLLTLVNGEKLLVKNSPIDVMTKIRACRKGKEDELHELDPAPASTPPRRKPDTPAS